MKYLFDYEEQRKTKEWRDRRREILVRDRFRCQKCGDRSYHNEVHHICYENDLLYWEYEDHYLITLCRHCHQEEHDIQKRVNKVFKEMRLSGLFWTEIKEKIDLKISESNLPGEQPGFENDKPF
jgi:5-methylcytosine-specific restriction protein A